MNDVLVVEDSDTSLKHLEIIKKNMNQRGQNQLVGFKYVLNGPIEGGPI